MTSGGERASPGTGWVERYMGGSVEAERALFDRFLPRVNRIQDVVAARQPGGLRRAFHNKGTVVRLRFEVAPDLHDALRAGFLRPGAVYDGFGRFSRSQSFRNPDGAHDQRGFAFRITTDEGPQDLLFSNTPASFARDPVQFLTVATIFAESRVPIAALRVLAAVGLREGIRILGDLLRAPDRTLPFTGQRYWTRTPFQLGDVAARFFVRPTASAGRIVEVDDPDFLATRLASDLRRGPMAFDLCAQLFVDEARTPIEDASRIWDEADAPPIVVGRITIPEQDLAGLDAEALHRSVEETVAFSPIVSTGLRPLGRMNRARELAYDRSADHRGAARRA